MGSEQGYFNSDNQPEAENITVKTDDPYASATVWDNYYTGLVTKGQELNPQGWWAPAVWPFLDTPQIQRVLDVGCGMGGDAVALAQKGLHVTAMDYSEIALACAQAKAAAIGVAVAFRQADMALPLPFADGEFDAVMSNVALHMFDDQTTRRIIREMRRVVRPGGLLVLHVNSTEDLPYREKLLGRPRVQSLGPNFYREANGQTMHFFSEEYCREVLAEWAIVDLTHLPLRNEAGVIFKCVWRCVARKPAAQVSPE
jgi:SAM-dependent methyltransferase